MRQGVEFGDAALRVVRADAERVAHAVQGAHVLDQGDALGFEFVDDARVRPIRARTVAVR